LLPIVLFQDTDGLSLERQVVDETCITFHLRTTNPTARCPLCDSPSSRVHSRYQRELADLPWRGRVARLLVKVRRFFCGTPACPRSIFGERLPALAAVRARTSVSLDHAHRHIGFALGGEAGSRLATRLSMPTSPDTLLRRIRRAPELDRSRPRVPGVDDWAFRKGTRYGTLLCDLERRHPVDLLPDRQSETLAAWLKARPGVAVISRDRAGPYALGARLGAPDAVQVADRWHLLCNLREAVERLLDRKQSQLREAAKKVAPEAVAPGEPPRAVTAPELSAPQQINRAERLRQARRQRRLERYERVKELHRRGVGLREIARGLRISRRTVRRFVRAESFPERLAARPRTSRVARFADHVRRRWQEGCENVAELHREVRALGGRCSYATLRRQVGRLGCLRSMKEGQAVPRPQLPRVTVPSTRRVSHWLLKDMTELEDDERRLVEQLHADDEIPPVVESAKKFAALVRRKGSGTLEEWLREVECSSSAEMRGFSGGVRQDQAAVEAALTLPWSNGPVEGQVNRLKVIKRQRYGRANFDLLRRRVLQPS
jgi:transposase